MVVCQHNYPMGFGGSCPKCTWDETKENYTALAEANEMDITIDEANKSLSLKPKGGAS